MKRYIELVYTHSNFNGRWLRCYSVRVLRSDPQLHITVHDLMISETLHVIKLKFWKNITKPPIQLVPGTLSQEVKRPGREADHSPPTSTELKKTWVYIFTPPYAFMA
jgi:hypothetical protein